MSTTSSPTVVVTGASGFIAGHIIEQLLAKGYKVKGSVRSLADGTKVKHLHDNFPGLELFEADLLAPGSFDDAIAGSDYVIHTASPFIISVADPQRDLLDPAIKGTINVLEAVKKCAFGIRRRLSISVHESSLPTCP
jgi:dihydroflavonol-4-reductase